MFFLISEKLLEWNFFSKLQIYPQKINDKKTSKLFRKTAFRNNEKLLSVITKKIDDIHLDVPAKKLWFSPHCNLASLPFSLLHFQALLNLHLKCKLAKVGAFVLLGFWLPLIPFKGTLKKKSETLSLRSSLQVAQQQQTVALNAEVQKLSRSSASAFTTLASEVSSLSL